MFDRKIITTKDGSKTLLVEHLGETFHSVHGADTEANHVYIKNGLLPVFSTFTEPVKILELGFGSGLNALFTAIRCQEWKRETYYTALEAYPLRTEEWKSFALGIEEKDLFSRLHKTGWEQFESIHPFFHLLKKNIYFEDYHSKEAFHLIYFDVFGYNYQPELWSEEMLKNMYDALIPNGYWVSYACKGIVTRRLKKTGFEVHKIPGPPGKREMTVAIKI